ncbi:Diguanylate cyclase VdcA [Pseudidiomarina piscicola]|uniref:diguanylate cyclase n=1 Tax=Pseudidiomarina piscicola TaxID=2614830 RepID=A0A7D9N2N9_9GAMM|nr:diguanylate cyclase [Pseudidiomarina piscicola]CAB0151873.1 Diguanylate cyclase VdcA [Pseudidiomarina piscicola]VZT41319.1 Diguanylate cyclase VdcA [Pseudomonas aeruginosa]
MPTSSVNHQLTNVSWGLGFGALAALTNYFLAVEVYGSVTILLGQLFVFLALFSRGLSAALVAAVMSAAAVYLYTQNLFFFVTLIAEVVTVYALFQRRMPILLADLLYWLALGIPATYLYLPTITDLPNDFLLLILAKLVFNGLLYTALAILVFQLVPRSWRVVPMQSVSDSLTGRIFYLSFLSIIVASLSVSFLYTTRSARQVEAQIVSDLSSKANSLREVTDDFLNDYVVAVRNLRDNLQAVASYDEQVEIMDRTQHNYPSFVSMLRANAEGKILHGAPNHTMSELLKQNTTVPDIDDRDYFQQPKETQQGFVSSAFRGRGFGTQPIIAISQPLLTENGFQGIVEGSLDLPELTRLVRKTDIDPQFQAVVVTDDQDQIIFSSEKFSLVSLANFTPRNVINLYSQELPLTRIDNEDLLYTQRINSYGWNIYVFSTPSRLTDLFSYNLIILVIFLAIITTLLALVTRRFALEITHPLDSLAEQLKQDTNADLSFDKSEMSREVRTIADSLVAARKLMVSFNRQLQNQVAEKTSDLEHLNSKLEKLAHEDGLTELLNRRTFDDLAEQRYHEAMATRQPVALILMDIDHFKRINDTMGHPVGDECIRSVGWLLKEYFERQGCLVGRYGGEEFAVFMSDSRDLLKLAEQFQNALATQCQANGETIPLSMSMGIVEVRQNFSGGSFRRLVAQADKLLYQSKDSGRNRISIETL